ncbi:MAG: holo-ACP synthase [Pyrinomonadaceae bacterium]|nr:holo-ACP synthase [Pyrinomonadaceae bacterium]
MIISIGIDIIEVARIRQTIERTPRFVTRVFTQREIDYCDSKNAVRANSYAARFAAKEATLKALKTGWRGAISWHDVEICNDANGAPFLEIRNAARQIFDDSGANKIHLSMSHTNEHAIATVILEQLKVEN